MRELDVILDLPVHYLRYIAWHRDAEQIAASSTQRQVSTLMVPTVPRFDFALTDLLEVIVGVKTIANGGRTTVESEQGTCVVDVEQSAVETVLSVVRDVGGSATDVIDELLARGLHIQRPMKFLSRLAGVALAASASVDALEAEVWGGSIARYPSSPYHVLRDYWQNMIDVRRELLSMLANGRAITTDEVRRLHVITLMGATLDNFYKPHSPVSDHSVWPGHLRTRQTQVTFPGADYEAYVGLAARSLGIDPERWRKIECLEQGLSWGTGRAVKFAGSPALFFRPPEKPSAAHLEQMWDVLHVDAVEPQRTPSVAQLATFHQRFVRLHPFECGNNSLALNIVNCLLERAHGVVVPHLHLDMIALFVPECVFRAS